MDGTRPAGDVLKIGLPRFGRMADGPDTAVGRFYLPPERAAGRLDQRADFYGTGMLLYVMCTGREPPAEVMASAAGGKAVPPPRAVAPERGITEALERVILRAVAPSPNVRFGTAEELMAALQSAGARSIPAKRQPTRRPRQWTSIVAAASAAVALLGAGALRSSGRQGPRAPQAALPPLVAQAVPVPPKLAVAPPAPPPPPPPPAPPSLAMAEPPSEADQGPRPRLSPRARRAPPRPCRERRPRRTAERSGRCSTAGDWTTPPARIKALLANDPDAAWPRFALGVLEARRYWRRDAVKHWRAALAQDPEVQQDPQFGAYLCFMLDDAWKAAGVTDLLNQLGARAVPLLERCVASAKNPRLRSSASRALDQVTGDAHRARSRR